ncbi:bcl-2-modifying factor-like isoform X2 [Cyprinodon tularosa]|uniref:bcl-2-modifying factor isoform X2 n=1 Tax=Cyprinodon variegatus TaxID=28743 RepID=UPI0007429321|nr:PREDICTED: bcl-2-modifying factor isoform X2 [Cyprinodon variegatus]XP_038147383.1 bcl-2-modifying factor-like isoform X2 [Cyprinodon tularosa]
MEEEEDDVFEPDPNSWHTPFREIKFEDRGTQTPGPGVAPHNVMLPCGVVEEPRPLFYPHFELVGDFDVRRQAEHNRMEQLPLQQPAALSLEACIGQKLQIIGDQFHREHLQQIPGQPFPHLVHQHQALTLPPLPVYFSLLSPVVPLCCGVSSKPKESGAAVVAHDCSSSQPPV